VTDPMGMSARVEALADDERLIFESLLSRLERGRRDYGPWKVGDGRDLPAEAFEEVLDAMHYTAAELVRLRRLDTDRRRRVYVCHPFADDPVENAVRVRLICRRLVHAGVVPVAPSIYWPQFLDDLTERDLGQNVALELLGLCDELWVYGDRVTERMERELAEARVRQVTVRFIEEGA
jgi:hypothetical protein